MKRSLNIIAQEIARVETNEIYTKQNYIFLNFPSDKSTQMYWDALRGYNDKKKLLIEELLTVAELEKASYSEDSKNINLKIK